MQAPKADGMPMLGLGTWQNDSHDQCAASVETALEMGYRHIDTAQIYRNEAAVGDGIAASSVDRDQIFLATKVWISNLSAEDVIESTKESLDKLGTEYLDLLYVHWPARTYDPERTLAAFDELRDSGLIERVGVSNFEPTHLEVAAEQLSAPIFANQVEMHPLLPQKELRVYAEKNDIELVAYSPLARTEIFSDPTLTAIADGRGVSEAQIALSWLRAKGVTAIPKATGETHIRDNWESLSVELDSDEIERIDGIENRVRQVHPDFAPASWG